MSGEPYSSQQIAFLESLCDQAALAIERAQVVANMENRVREMNVLARVAQGVNITLTLDDILELVYTQTDSIIPAEIFTSCCMTTRRIFTSLCFTWKMMTG